MEDTPPALRCGRLRQVLPERSLAGRGVYVRPSLAGIREDHAAMSDQVLPPRFIERKTLVNDGLSAEQANQLTHFLGFAIGLVAATALLLRAISVGGPVRIAGCLIYGGTMVALYAASTLSHSFSDPDRRQFYRMLDQVCIFLFAAGSFTPFALVHFSSPTGWALLATMWAAALFGCWRRITKPEETICPWLIVPLGWVPVFAMFRILEVGGWGGLATVLAGGLAYSGGLWFLMNDNRHRYFHAVWHLFTITGTLLHFGFTFGCVVG